MTWSIDPPVTVSGGVCAAIVETRVAVRPVMQTIVGSAEKRPVLVLTLRDNTVRSIDMEGEPVSAEDVESRFPTAIAQLKALHRKAP